MQDASETPEEGTGMQERLAQSAAELVARLGPHPAAAVGLGPDPDDDDELAAWWTLCCLLDTRRGDEARALAAYRALAERGPVAARVWARTTPGQLREWLEAAGHPRAEPVAALLWRGARSLCERHAGSLVRLARECDGLEELAAGLSGLAPGFGRAAVVRFLQPLRDGWPAAADLPLDPAALTAAVHLGWLTGGEDEDGGPGVLRARIGSEPPAPAWQDVEAALTRLGRRACLRERVSRCPLGAACPRRRPRDAAARAAAAGPDP